MAEQAESLKVEIPGGEPLEFDNENEAAAFEDAELAGDVPIHLNSPLAGQRVQCGGGTAQGGQVSGVGG